MSLSRRSQQGYTLIELMVSIVLGLLVTAAAIQLFVTGQASYHLQRSLASLQDNGSFGMNYLVSDIRKVNLGAQNALMTDQTPYSGVLLTDNNADKTGNALSTYLKNNSLYTSQAVSPSNVAVQSDQLTIQYVPQQPGYDCAGNQITTAMVSNQVHIIQRYFVRNDTAGDKDLALVCAAAAFYVDANGAAYTSKDGSGNNILDVSALKGTGQIIIPRVDYFHVLFSTSKGHFDSPTSQAYSSVNSYLAGNCTSASPIKPPCYIETWEDPSTAVHEPFIRGIQIGLLVRATDSAGGNAAVSAKNNQAFKVLDTSVTLNAAALGATSTTRNTTGNMRQSLSQTIAFRNAAGEGNK